MRYIFTDDAPNTIEEGPAGSIRVLGNAEVPGMANMSLLLLELSPGGLAHPVWHVNAAKVGYCITGEVVVTIHTPGQTDQFKVQAGEIFFIPSGSIHSIGNHRQSKASIRFALSQGQPETLMLSASVDATAADALRSTFPESDKWVQGLKTAQTRHLLGMLQAALSTEPTSNHRLKFNIDGSDKVINNRGGFLQVGLKINLPTLENGGVLGFGINPGGAVEPHWHPNSDEIVYITKGRVAAMVLTPDGTVERSEVGPGGGFYAPNSYFHSFEQVGSESVEGVAFFNNPEMVYMGLGEALGAFSDDILRSAFDLEADAFDGLHKPAGPLVLVPE